MDLLYIAFYFKIDAYKFIDQDKEDVVWKKVR